MESDLIEIYFADLDESPVSIRTAESILSEDELERSLRFKFDVLSNRFLTRRWLLRQVLSSHIGQSPHNLKFEYGDFGKPRLKEGSPVSFNLSHSSRWCAIAVCRGSEIGVDIEEIESETESELISARFFTEREAEQIRSGADVQTEFFKCWTRKEAVIKAVGTGLSMPLDKFQVNFDEDAPKLEWIEVNGENAESWTLFSIRPADKLIASIAVRNSNARLRDHDWLDIGSMQSS